MTTYSDVFSTLEPSPVLRRFEALLAPKTDAELEAMAQEAHAITLAHFGRAMRLFAPIYLSNECINTCKYCGFSRDNPILRVTLEVEQLKKEARHLTAQGFRNLLLVAGEHPKFVSNGYLEACIRALVPEVPAVSLEVGPMETDEYVPMVEAGAEGLIVYQETYHQPTYADLHVSGPKKNFLWRLACPERAYAAGFRRIGIGALFGLWEWKEEALSLASHLDYLLRHCWKAQFSVSFPRMRPAAGGFQPRFHLPDREFVQLICATRICFPQVAIVLSTRETPAMRDALIPLGITMMSAGSHTEPGGYTGQGREALHQTVRGRQIALETCRETDAATSQFEISDARSPAQIAALLGSLGYEAVWKDWDQAILTA
ncbi:MAG TPA: 2-iminoacetate synthase ThiH [Chthoniobacteraceae bacterium]|nr:2-iminoacetate synthase ThiH [Chthoniobacteraceae bacterium]